MLVRIFWPEARKPHAPVLMVLERLVAQNLPPCDSRLMTLTHDEVAQLAGLVRLLLVTRILHAFGAAELEPQRAEVVQIRGDVLHRHSMADEALPPERRGHRWSAEVIRQPHESTGAMPARLRHQSVASEDGLRVRLHHAQRR